RTIINPSYPYLVGAIELGGGIGKRTFRSWHLKLFILGRGQDVFEGPSENSTNPSLVGGCLACLPVMRWNKIRIKRGRAHIRVPDKPATVSSPSERAKEKYNHPNDDSYAERTDANTDLCVMVKRSGCRFTWGEVEFLDFIILKVFFLLLICGAGIDGL